jgi:hypothetical protein
MYSELDEFFSLCLYSAGSGKTTQTRNRILMQEGKHIVLYMATRKVLVDTIQKLKELEGCLRGKLDLKELIVLKYRPRVRNYLNNQDFLKKLYPIA